MRRVVAGLIAAALAASAAAQEKFEVKVAEFVGPQHFMTQWLVKWGEELGKASNGRLVFKHFPGAQMGPAPAHYDLARNGLIATATALKFDLHAPAATWMLDVGVDVISRDGRAGISLGAYAAALDRQMVPHAWSP